MVLRQGGVGQGRGVQQRSVDDATLTTLLLYLQTQMMLRKQLFSCTCCLRWCCMAFVRDNIHPNKAYIIYVDLCRSNLAHWKRDAVEFQTHMSKTTLAGELELDGLCPPALFSTLYRSVDKCAEGKAMRQSPSNSDYILVVRSWERKKCNPL